jgi:hypothetical protein
MIVLFYGLKVLHVAAAGAWFGVKLTAPGDIRQALALGRPHTTQLVPRIRRGARIAIGSGVATLLSGLALVLAAGGFAAVPLRIHISLALVLLLFVLGGLVIDPTWKRIARLIESDGDLAEAQHLARRFGMLMGVEHLLWTAVLVLMLVPAG